jgi:hypothetical protein
MEKLRLPLSTQARVGLFALGLAVVFSASFLIGSAFEPADTEAGGSHGGAAHDAPIEHGEEEKMSGHDEHTSSGPTAAAAGGLAISEGGYTLRMGPVLMKAGEERELRFQVEGPDGEAVRDFDRLHEREMHLILVRRDGAHFQHLHPELDASGTWATAVVLPAAGVYRAFADFSADGHDHTLAGDLFASGAFEARPFPAPAASEETAGYELRLEDASIVAGRASALRFAVSRGGRELTDLQDYLGAKGHLVALREGDLAFLHVHPDEQEAPSVIPFTAHFPTAGRYHLYLQFRHAGEVRTAEFTVEVER